MFSGPELLAEEQMIESVKHLSAGVLNILLEIFERNMQKSFCSYPTDCNVVETDEMITFRHLVESISQYSVESREKFLREARLLWAIKATNEELFAQASETLERIKKARKKV